MEEVKMRKKRKERKKDKKKGENLWLIWNLLMLNETLILWLVAPKMGEQKRKEKKIMLELDFLMLFSIAITNCSRL
jgi:hypothetical protein